MYNELENYQTVVVNGLFDGTDKITANINIDFEPHEVVLKSFSCYDSEIATTISNTNTLLIFTSNLFDSKPFFHLNYQPSVYNDNNTWKLISVYGPTSQPNLDIRFKIPQGKQIRGIYEFNVKTIDAQGAISSPTNITNIYIFFCATFEFRKYKKVM